MQTGRTDKDTPFVTLGEEDTAFVVDMPEGLVWINRGDRTQITAYDDKDENPVGYLTLKKD